MSNFDAVTELVQGYFHEDWGDDYADPWDVVDDFIDDQPQLAADLPEEVNSLLQQCPSEVQLKEFLDGLHFSYYVPADNWTYRGWMTAVADRMKQAKAG
jgi:hypothetical protein